MDLSEVTFLDSTGIRVFARAANDLRDRCCVVLHGAPPSVIRVLELVQLGSVRNIHVEDCAERRVSFGDGPGT